MDHWPDNTIGKPTVISQREEETTGGGGRRTENDLVPKGKSQVFSLLCGPGLGLSPGFLLVLDTRWAGAVDHNGG